VRLSMARARVLAFVACCLMLPACAQLSGTISIAGESNEVRRGAGVLVVLVPATPEFDTRWHQFINAYQSQVEQVLTSMPTKAQVAADRTLARRRTDAQIEAIHIFNEYMQRADQMIRAAAVATGTADASGHYELPRLRVGPYHAYAKFINTDLWGFRGLSNTHYWFLPLELAVFPPDLDFSERNEAWPFDPNFDRP
jgi:hypothetical protein